MIRIRLINEGKVVKQITSRVHEGVVLEQIKKYSDPYDTVQIVEGELSEDAKSVLQHVARKIIPAAMAAGVAMGGANAQAQGGANPNYPGMDRSIGQHISDIVSPRYNEIQRQRKYEQETQRKEWDAQQNELRQGRVDAARTAGRTGRGITNYKLYDQSRISKDGKHFLIYGMDDKITRIPTAGTEFMAADSQRLAHYISPSGQVYYVRHPHNNGLGESVLDDVRARMDARRNPAAKPVAAPAAPVADQAPKFKVGDNVSFAIGRGIPATGTITAMGPGPTQLTVKTAEGENKLDTRMKSLYLQLAPAATEPGQEAASPAARPQAVDTKGRTQYQWEKAVMAKYPDAQIQKTMGIDSPMLAILPDGRRLSWTKVEPAVAVTAEAMDRLPRPANWKAPEPTTRPRPAAQKQMEVGDIIGFTPQQHDATSSGKVFKAKVLEIGGRLGRSGILLKLLNPEDIAANSGKPTMKISFWGANIKNPYVEKAQQGLDEAGEWKAEAEDFKEWSNHVKDALLGVAESQRFAMAKKLSQIEMKHFGAGQATSSFNSQTGASTGNSSGMTTTVQHILDAINAGKLTAATSSTATAAIASAGTTQQTAFGSVTKPEGQPDPYHASPASQYGDRPAAQSQARPQQGGGSIKILKTEEDWEEALSNQGSDDVPNTAAGLNSAMSKLPTWKVMLATIMLASKLPVIGDKIKNTIISSIQKEFGVTMSFKEALGYMQHVRNTPAEEIVSPAVWKFEKDGGDYETAIEELPDDVVDVRPAEVMSTIANSLISAGVAEEITPGDDTPSDAGAGAFGNMASQLSNKTESVIENLVESAEQMTPNWAKYVLDQIYNSNGEVSLTDLFDEGIPGLHAMFMDTAQKHGLNTDDEFEDVQHELTLELEDLIKGGHDLDEAVGTIGTVGTIPASGASAVTQKTQFSKTGGTTDVKFNSKGQLELDDEIDPEAIDTLKKAGVEVAEATGVSPELSAILDQYSDAYDEFKAGGDLTDNITFYEALVNFFSDSKEMPYDVATSGDPAEWISNKLDQMSGAQPMGESDDEASAADQAGADKNIIMQIRRAADYEIPVAMKLGDGSSIKIDSQTANKMLNQFNKLKPESKALMQQTLNTEEGFREMLNYFNEREVQEDMQFIEQISNHMKPIAEAKLRANNLIKSVFGR